jgi:glycerol uptake facilitator-like aquaporin
MLARTSQRSVPFFIAAQLVGAVAAALLVRWLAPAELNDR